MGQTWCVPPPGTCLQEKELARGNSICIYFFCNEIKGKPLIRLLFRPVRVLQAEFQAAVQGACSRQREQRTESR